MNRLVYGVLLVSLSTPALSQAKKEGEGHALIRLYMNNKCMTNAAEINKATSQNYNDLDEVVAECSSVSFYQSNHFCNSTDCSLEKAKEYIKILEGVE